jgi:hypothetical protein
VTQRGLRRRKPQAGCKRKTGNEAIRCPFFFASAGRIAACRAAHVINRYCRRGAGIS